MRQVVWILIEFASVCIGLYGCHHLQAAETRTGNNGGERLEISFRFHRGGIASSQYAIWIEDESGRLVRTLYATSFTVKGGYEYREDAIPLWVGKANPQTMTSAQVDAITGATPQNGYLTYKWDGTDDKGNRLPPGIYKFFVEGSLYWKSRVLYSGKLHWGNKVSNPIPVEVRYFNQSSTNENMITGLKAYHISK